MDFVHITGCVISLSCAARRKKIMQAWSLNRVVRTPLLVMAGVEALIVFSSVYFAGLISFGDLAATEEIAGPLAPRAVIGASVVFVCMVSMGLYQLDRRIHFREVASRILVAMIASCVVMATIFRVTPIEMWTNEIATIALIYALVLLFVVRYVFTRTVDDNVFRTRTFICGDGARANSIADLRRRADRRGFKIVGQYLPENSMNVVSAEVCESVLQLAIEAQADEIVVAMDERRGTLPVRQLLDARLKGINVIELMEFLERETGKIRVDLVNIGWLVFSSGFRTSRLRSAIKRLIDVAVCSVLLLVTWPIMILISVAIKIEDGLGADVLYKQTRVGRGDLPFNIVKFRSMRPDAEASGHAVWAETDDPRITRVGRVLRKFRLDELPQIFNVLHGQMSLVGPRPERPEFVDKLKQSIPYYSERHTVQPGITGWAQLHYAYASSEEDAIEKLQYDLYYVKNHGLVLDIITILQTVEVVLWGKGAR